MTKVTLNNVASFQNDTTAVATVNANNATIVAAFDNTLSRDGTAPNTMGSTLDMNSNRVINLPAPRGATEPVRAGDFVAATSAPVYSGGSNITVAGTTISTTTTPTFTSITAPVVNKVAITAPATTATLTIANNKTLAVNNSLTLQGTDSTVMTFPSVSSTLGTGNVSSVTAGTGLSGGTITGVGTIALALTNNGTTFLPANPTATGSSSPAMMGVGSTCKFTPVYSGRALVILNGAMSQSVTGGMGYQLRFGTGTIPTNQQAATGTIIGTAQIITGIAGNTITTPMCGVITGLTVGVQVWLDVAINTGGSGTATATAISISVVEF